MARREGAVHRHRGLPHHRRRIGVPARPERLRQEHAAVAAGRRAGGRRRPRHAAGPRLVAALGRRARPQPRGARGLHLPAVQPAALPERARQRAAALPLLGAARSTGRAPRQFARRSRAPARPDGPGPQPLEAPGAAALGGPAAARGRGARAHRPARGGDCRRAHFRARRRPARGLSRRAADGLRREPQRARVREPRPAHCTALCAACAAAGDQSRSFEAMAVDA
jgi:hypothetical protein